MTNTTIKSRSALLAVATVVFAMACIGAKANAQGASPSDTKVVTVEIRDFKFEPETVTVHEGDTVEWKNEDSAPHTATEDVADKKPAFDSGSLQKGAAWRYVAQKKGTYNYICTFHPYMRGTLIVQ